MNIQTLYAIMIFSSSLELYSRSVTKSISIDYIEEKVNGVVFTYRCDVIDGVIEEVWTVAGKKIDKNDYEKKILEQELEERRQQRDREYEARMQKLTFKESASRIAYQKLLSEISCQLEELFDKFHTHDLIPLIVFSEDTIASSKLLHRLQTKELAAIKKLVSDSNAEVIKLQKMYENFANYPERLMQCLYQTVQHAVSTVDDTKQLKDLLVLISQES